MAVTVGNNAAQLELFYTAFETRFAQAYKFGPSMYNKIAATYNVGTEQWVSGWLNMVQKYRQWIGPRIVHTPNPQTYLVPILLWENSQAVDAFRAVHDDIWGIYSTLPEDMGKVAAKWPDWAIRDLLQNQGASSGNGPGGQLCLDGLTAFNTAHPSNLLDASQGTFPNDFTGGGVSINGILVGGALSANALSTIFQASSQRKNESGEAWNAVPTANMCGPQLKWAQDTILQATIMGVPYMPPMGTGNFPTAGAPTPANGPLIGTSDNLLKGIMESLMWVDLGGSATVGGGTYDQVFYTLCENLGGGVKPFSWLLSEAPNLIVQNKPTDPLYLDKHMIGLYSYARGTAAWGFPASFSRSGA